MFSNDFNLIFKRSFAIPNFNIELVFYCQNWAILSRANWLVNDFRFPLPFIEGGKTTVIVATGGIEQNGPYVVTSKHNYVLQAITEAIARKLGNALVAPIIKFVPEGNINPPSGHMQYPGTISLREETFKLLLIDICGSLKRHGFTDIILIGDSYGNQQGMKDVAGQLNRDLNTQWRGHPTQVHYIPEYYEQDIWSFDYLKTIGIFQQPDIKSAVRAGVHSDYHYESILAMVSSTYIRAYQQTAEIGANAKSNVEIADGKINRRNYMLENAGRFIDRHTMVWMRKLDVPVTRVWEAVSTKQGLDKWWMCPVEIDLRPGGAFSHHWENTITDYKDGTRFTGHYTDGQMDGTFTGYYADDGILEQTFQMGKEVSNLLKVTLPSTDVAEM